MNTMTDGVFDEDPTFREENWACSADEAALRQIENNHRIANSLQVAAAILMRERRSITDAADAKAVLAATASRLMAIGRLHRTLCRATPTEDVDLGDFLMALRDDIADSMGTTLSIDASDVALPAATAVQIGIVVSEMAINAIKHARRDGRPVSLTVEGDRNGLGEVRLRIHDNGSGFPDGFDLDRDGGIGMTVIKTTIERLGGYIYTMPRFGPYLLIGAGLEIVLPPKSRCVLRVCD